MKKILIVDDDPGILEAISMILEESDYKTDVTTKGDETYQKIAKFIPDLIILDILMSGSDGREICKKLKAGETTKQSPIIMISAHPNAEKSIEECGANDFLPKPFEIDALLVKIKKHI